MVTTTWTAGSGDWNAASNWNNGAPGAGDTALFDQTVDLDAPYTVAGGGDVAALAVINGTSQPGTVALAGTVTAGTFTVGYAGLELAGTAALSFVSGQVYKGGLQLDGGATLGSGPLTLTDAGLEGTLGVLANALDLTGTTTMSQASGTLAGAITGSGGLALGTNNFVPAGGNLVLSHASNTYAGGTDLIGGRLEIAAPGAAGTGPVNVENGTLVLDAGVSLGTINAAIRQYATVTTVDGNDTVFGGIGFLTVANGSGHVEVIGRYGVGDPGANFEAPADYEGLSVTGGTGSVTVFAADAKAMLFGGTAGSNLLVAGTTLTGPTSGFSGRLSATSEGSSIGGGGNGDLLVLTGNVNNLAAAGGGNETLTGAGASGNNVFFGGTGSDLIATGAGQDLVVAGSGAATISGGSGAAAIFVGKGPDIVLGGGGADYVQAGAGNATMFAGAGMDLIGVTNGQAGGSLVVSGFRTATDRISAQGYAAGPVVTTGGGNTVLTFSDHTQVTLLGVASLPGAAFL